MNRPWLPLLFGLVLVGLAVSACSNVNDADPSDPTSDAQPTTRPTDDSDESDDPTNTPRSENEDLPPELVEILDRVAELRGLEAPDNLSAELLPRSELPETLEALTTEDDLRWFAEITTIYRLLGYIENDEDYYDIYNSFGASGILGFYLPSEDKLWVVVDDGDEIDWDDLPFLEESTLVHELVHAIQDFHFDLGETSLALGSDLDANMAYTALVEGDASTFEEIYLDEYLLAAPGPDGGVLLLKADPTQIAGVSEAVIRSLYFPYTTGANWITNIVNDGGTEAVDALYEDPKLATSYVLHPNLLDDGWEPESVDLPDLEDLLGSDWELESEGTLGEFHLANYLQIALGRIASETAADGWAGDSYEVWRDGDESVFVVSIAFADDTEADEFYETHTDFLNEAGEEERQGLSGGRRYYTLEDGDAVATLSVDGETASFVISSSPAVAELVASALD